MIVIWMGRDHQVNLICCILIRNEVNHIVTYIGETAVDNHYFMVFISILFEPYDDCIVAASAVGVTFATRDKIYINHDLSLHISGVMAVTVPRTNLAVLIVYQVFYMAVDCHLPARSLSLLLGRIGFARSRGAFSDVPPVPGLIVKGC